MKQITISVPDKKYPFFLELLKSLGFVKQIEPGQEATKGKILADLKESVNEVNLIKAGKLKGISAKDLINEL